MSTQRLGYSAAPVCYPAPETILPLRLAGLTAAEAALRDVCGMRKMMNEGREYRERFPPPSLPSTLLPVQPVASTEVSARPASWPTPLVGRLQGAGPRAPVGLPY